VVVVLALGLAAASAAIHRSTASPDTFYKPPRTVPARPGVLLRSEPYTRGIPEEWRAWRILYTTTLDENTPTVASGVVIASDHLPAGPRPVIAWAHGTTGVASQCAPSLLPSRWNADIIPGVNQALRRGWVIVATDYVGLGTPGPHPYLIGQGEARSVLDSVRAARQMPQLSLQRTTVVWGHSQGGHAALWAGTIAPTYAADVSVVGVAALAPASDLQALVEEVRNTLEGRILSAYILTAYSEIYPDVSFDHYVRPAARVLVRETARRCLDIPEAIPSAVTAVLSRQPIYGRIPTRGRPGTAARGKHAHRPDQGAAPHCPGPGRPSRAPKHSTLVRQPALPLGPERRISGLQGTRPPLAPMAGFSACARPVGMDAGAVRGKASGEQMLGRPAVTTRASGHWTSAATVRSATVSASSPSVSGLVAA
jgi:Secretory lipase